MEGLPDDAVVLDAPGASFGAAIRRALDHLPAIGPSDDATHWLWFLHDDSAPAPDALSLLLDAVEKAPSVTMAGCKQRDAAHPEILLEVGLSMTRDGHRFNRVGVEELDQGQYDALSDVLGVNTAGLLVRRDVFERLGGFDPALPGVGDDVDLGRREWLAGHRVIVVPEAVVHHRGDEVEAVSGPRAERRSAAYTRLKFAAGWLVIPLAVWMLVAGVGRALARLVAKDPSGAATELGAGATALVRPHQLAAGRRNVARHRRVPRGVVKALLADPSSVRDRRRTEREARSIPDEEARPRGAAEPSGGDDGFESLEAGRRPAGAATMGLVSVLLAAGLSLLGLYRLFGAVALQGGALVPTGTDLGRLWERATQAWQPLGTGATGAPDPFDFLLWLSGVVSFGHPQQAGVVLAVLALPLAALTAWFALGSMTRSPGFRLLGALAWSLAPALQIALAQGRPGAAVVHVLLPLFVLAVLRAVGAARAEAGQTRPGSGGRPSWAATACGSLLGAALVCAEPVLVLPLVLFGVVAALVSRRARALWWLPLPAIAIALPLLLRALSDPRVLLVQPGLPLASDTAPLWQQVLGWPVAVQQDGALPGVEFLGSGPWPWIVMGVVAVPLGLMALISLVRPGDGTTAARVLVLVSLVLLCGGALLARADVTVSGEHTIGLYVGSFVSFFSLALLLAAAAQREALAGRRGAGAGAGARTLYGVLGTLVTLSVLVLSTLWVAPRIVPGQLTQDALGTGQRVAATGSSPLPATAADRGLGRFAERTLVLGVANDGGLSATLASGDGVRLEDLSATVAAGALDGPVWNPSATERAATTAGEDAIRRSVASLASGEQQDVRPALSRLAVSYVVLASRGTGADLLAQELDAVPGLSPAGRADDTAWVWRVDPAEGSPSDVTASGSSTSRVRIEDKDGKILQLLANHEGSVQRTPVSSGDPGRRVVLAESADPSWRATLNGTPLSAVDAGWAQAFELPAGGGELRVWNAQPLSVPWLGGLAVVLVIALLSIVPVPRTWRVDAQEQRVYREPVSARRPRGDENAEEQA